VAENFFPWTSADIVAWGRTGELENKRDEQRNPGQETLKLRTTSLPQKEQSGPPLSTKTIADNAPSPPFDAEMPKNKTGEVRSPKTAPLRPPPAAERPDPDYSLLQTSSLHSTAGTNLGDSGNGEKRHSENAEATDSLPPLFTDKEKGTIDMSMILDRKAKENTTQNTSTSYNLRQKNKPTVISRKSNKKVEADDNQETIPGKKKRQRKGKSPYSKRYKGKKQKPNNSTPGVNN